MHFILLTVIMRFQIVNPQNYCLVTNIIKTITVTASCAAITFIVKKVPILKHTVQ